MSFLHPGISERERRFLTSSEDARFERERGVGIGRVTRRYSSSLASKLDDQK
jgi:hypothetical protein